MLLPMNHLHRMTIVDAPFSSVIEYVADFFSEHRHLRLKAVASSKVPVETRYEVMDDRTDAVRGHDALALSWRPRVSIFPRFEGTVAVRPHFSGSVLSLEGAYVPPGWIFGRFFDALIGQRLACATMDHLLRELRTYVERRYAQYRASCPTIEELNALGSR